VTIASLIARGQTIELPRYLNIALDSGVKPSEVSEMITHLTFYAGWANVFTALPVVKGVLERRP
jgi:4-carboxymuconolactone decarboxylase